MCVYIYIYIYIYMKNDYKKENKKHTQNGCY